MRNIEDNNNSDTTSDKYRSSLLTLFVYIKKMLLGFFF